MSKYTDQDVRVLVSQVEIFIKEYDKNYAIRPQFERDCVEEALAPFRPDPEEDLVREMVQAQKAAYGNATSLYGKKHDEAQYISMRAALAVVKEKGYFNDQR